MRVAPPTRRRAPQIRVAESGPFLGVRDSLDAGVSEDRRYARVMQNMMPLELDKPTTFVGRPGFDRLLTNQVSPFSGSFLGQLVHHFVADSGGQHIVIAMGGQLYAYHCADDIIAPVSTGLQSTARMFAASFGNACIVTDGVSVPQRVYDVDSLIPSVSAVSAAPVLYGAPVVYYAKIFGIKATERTVIVWSEENDVTIGYENTPYSNSWQLAQTDQEPLYALCATNEALYYFRARSIGTIRGAVTPEFTTDGTHEGISTTIGTTSPDGVCLGPDDKIYFLSADGEPCVIKGGKVFSLADNIRETIRTLDQAQLDKAITRYDPTTGLVYFAVVEINQTQPSCIICVNPVLDIPVAVWRGFTMGAMGIAKPSVGNATGTAGAPAANGNTVEPTIPAIVHLPSDGYVYVHGTPNGNIWDDYFVAGTTAIDHAYETCHLANDTSIEKRYSRTDIAMRVEDAVTGINVRQITPYGTSSAITGSVTGPPGTALGIFVLGTDVLAADVAERKLAVGLNQVGRWIRHRVTHAVVGEKFSVTAIATRFTPAGDSVQAA